MSQRQRRATGQWGKLKPLKLRPGRFDELDLEDDRTILSFLYGGTPDRSENGAIKTETAATVYRYYIPQELSERLLPLMCGTGRLRYLGSKEKHWTPLTWDEGEPWELAVRVDALAIVQLREQLDIQRQRQDRPGAFAEHSMGDAVGVDVEAIAHGQNVADHRVDATEQRLVLELLVAEPNQRLQRNLISEPVIVAQLQHLGVDETLDQPEDVGIGPALDVQHMVEIAWRHDREPPRGAEGSGEQGSIALADLTHDDSRSPLADVARDRGQ